MLVSGLRRVLLLGICLLVAGVTALRVAPSAEALSFTGTVSVPDGRLAASGCVYDYPLRWTATIDDEVESWMARTTVLGPDGRLATTTSYWGLPGLQAGTESLAICSADGPGRYIVQTDVTYYGYEGFGGGSVRLPDTSFTLRQSRTRTGLKASDRTPRYHQRMRLTVRSQLETRSGGYGDVGRSSIRLEYRYRGAWFPWAGTAVRTDHYGRFVYVFRHWDTRRSIWARAVTVGRTGGLSYALSVSPVVKIAKPRPRGH